MMRWVRTFPKPHSRIAGTGCNLPANVVSNHDIAALVEAPEKLKKHLPSLICRTTEVSTRRYAAEDVSPSDLGVPAVLQAVENAGRKLDDIDTLIYSSTDMDHLEPATANVLQQKLGLRQVNSFDVKNACNSFLQAMNIGNSLIATGAAKCVAICAAEVGSHFVSREVKDADDLRYKMGALTIGDAAAAFVLEPCTDGQGITEINLFNLGEYWPLCHVPHDVDWRKKTPRTIHGWFYLDMPELARIVRPLTIQYFRQYKEYRQETCKEQDFTQHLDKVIPHQISRRLIVEIVKSLQVDMKLVAITADEFGNTGAAAIPLTFHRVIESGELKLGSGQDVLLFGAASGLGMGHIRLRL